MESPVTAPNGDRECVLSPASPLARSRAGTGFRCSRRRGAALALRIFAAGADLKHTDLLHIARRADSARPSGSLRFPADGIITTNIAVPPDKEGRFAIVTDVGNGMRWTRQRQAQSLRGRLMLRWTAKSCGSGAPMQALRSR